MMLFRPPCAQVGYNEHSYAYRDLEGSKVHRGLREPYGQAFAEGDVVGCLLHMPPGGRPLEVQSRVRGEASCCPVVPVWMMWSAHGPYLFCCRRR